MPKSFVIKNVQTIVGENTSQIGTGAHTLDTPFEVRLKFPECSVASAMGHTDIQTLVKLRLFDASLITDLLKKGYEFPNVQNMHIGGMDERELCHGILYMLNNYDVTMNMTVEYHHFGNLKATSVEVLSVSYRPL